MLKTGFWQEARAESLKAQNEVAHTEGLVHTAQNEVLMLRGYSRLSDCCHHVLETNIIHFLGKARMKEKKENESG